MACSRQGGVSGEIDLLSIDIDNNDYWVWKAITRINPRVVVIEYNATLRPPMSLVVPYEPERTWDGATNYFGASLEAFVRLGRSKGYRLVGCSISGVNAFFVRDDIAGDHFFDPATAEELYEPPRYLFRDDEVRACAGAGTLSHGLMSRIESMLPRSIALSIAIDPATSARASR